MSNVNIKRVIENIRANTNVYTPVIEIIVNAIQAIEEKGPNAGKISINVIRDNQIELDGGLSKVVSFIIQDNGVGFTEEHRNAFDTLYTDHRISKGGKGFGRFTCLKYFDNLFIDSVYHDEKGYYRRKFSMGMENEIIVNERIEESRTNITGTIVNLRSLKKGKVIDKKLSTIARNLVEKLLPYFITEDYSCPEILLSEKDGTDPILLNNYVTNELSSVIHEIKANDTEFVLKSLYREENFQVRIFKLYFPKNQPNKITLVAHKREVVSTAIHKYIPEFIEGFYEKDNGNTKGARNFIVKAYVFGSYLDENVSLERGGFEFQMENDLVHGIGQSEIERGSAEIIKDAVGTEISLRQEKKRERVQLYVDEKAPWHKQLLSKIDLTGMPYNPTEDEIENRLQREKFSQETMIKKDVSSILAEPNFQSLERNVKELVSKISGTSRNDLIHYIALRRNIIDIFGKSLELNEEGKYSSEGIVHDIIFPRKGDTDVTSFIDHNLWIIDERLNFTNYVSSDNALNGLNSSRPDLLVYDKRILFRGDNEPSNPVTIFEFKKPQRDDFVNPSSKEDPIEQIIRYVNDIRDGKYKTPSGRKVLVADNTPFYGFVICDLSKKVEDWLTRVKNFKPMPDRMGWFLWYENINLYMEVISWDKVHKDVKMRNQIFFEKLGI